MKWRKTNALDAALAPYDLQRREYGPEEGRVDSLVIPWTGDEWLSVLDKEGPWLPSCCAVISEARDILLGTLREGRRMEARKLREFVEVLGSHDGFRPEDRGEVHPDHEDPVMRLFWLWEQIADEAAVGGLLGEKPIPCDLGDVTDAADALDKMLWPLRMLYFTEGAAVAMEKGGGKIDFVSPYSKDGLTTQSHVNRIEMLRRGLPAIRTLYRHLAEVDPGPFEGVALVEIATGHVPRTLGGLAIYADEARARETLAYWERDPDSAGKYAPRACRVSLEHGIELLPAAGGGA